MKLQGAVSTSKSLQGFYSILVVMKRAESLSYAVLDVV